jgi:hypothetical protein
MTPKARSAEEMAEIILGPIHLPKETRDWNKERIIQVLNSFGKQEYERGRMDGFNEENLR